MHANQSDMLSPTLLVKNDRSEPHSYKNLRVQKLTYMIGCLFYLDKHKVSQSVFYKPEMYYHRFLFFKILIFTQNRLIKGLKEMTHILR